MMIAVNWFGSVSKNLFIVPCDPEIDGGAVEIEASPVCGPKLFASNKVGSEGLGKKAFSAFDSDLSSGFFLLEVLPQEEGIKKYGDITHSPSRA
jgi:hypothetical protein